MSNRSAFAWDFIAGVAKVGERFIILLDVNHVLSMNELVARVG